MKKNKQNAFILKVTKLPHIHVKMDNRALISAPAKKNTETVEINNISYDDHSNPSYLLHNLTGQS